MRTSFFLATFLFAATFSQSSFAQNEKEVFTHADTLRGSNGPFRQKWDVLRYDLAVQPDYNSKSLRGSNAIRFFDSGVTLMQLDLQEPMQLDSVADDHASYKFRREGNVYWVMLRDSAARYKIKPGARTIVCYFHGVPREAVKAPWDGGWLWKKDRNGNPWMTVACQGLGASVWYPCKDYQGDKPDSGASLSITVPDTLVAVANGRLVSESVPTNGLKTFSWNVNSPINNYCLVPYIGKYVHFSEIYPGLKGDLNMDYWVLNYNLEKAKQQFKDAPKMMKAFEYWFGPYPFYNDGYKLVDAPHLGMEHQSAIAYGNGYRQGYAGRDLSASGEGLKWDFIIVHESGHEWWGNNICSIDLAEMWLHEGFTDYSETLFTEYYWGKEAATRYISGLRHNISNDKPIIAHYGVNEEGSGDMYYKGANMLHLIRQMVHNDDKFRAMLHGLQERFGGTTVTSAMIEQYMIKYTGLKLQPIFNQYLRTTMVPMIEYSIKGNRLNYRLNNAVKGFSVAVPVTIGSSKITLRPQSKLQTVRVSASQDEEMKIDPDYYLLSKRI